MISSTPDTIQQDCWAIVPIQWCEVANKREVLNVWGHLGLLAKTTAVLVMRLFYFQLLSEAPLPSVYSSPDPRNAAKRAISCQDCSFKRQMQKLCVDVSVWESLEVPKDTKKFSTFSKVSISVWAQAVPWSTSKPFVEARNPQNYNSPHVARIVKGYRNTRAQAAEHWSLTICATALLHAPWCNRLLKYPVCGTQSAKLNQMYWWWWQLRSSSSSPSRLFSFTECDEVMQRIWMTL